jgi:hypothetical protein
MLAAVIERPGATMIMFGTVPAADGLITDLDEVARAWTASGRPEHLKTIPDVAGR